MQAAAVILVMAAAAAFILSSIVFHVGIVLDPIERMAHENETRSFGWRLSKRFPQGKSE